MKAPKPYQHHTMDRVVMTNLNPQEWILSSITNYTMHVVATPTSYKVSAGPDKFAAYLQAKDGKATKIPHSHHGTITTPEMLDDLGVKTSDGAIVKDNPIDKEKG